MDSNRPELEIIEKIQKNQFDPRHLDYETRLRIITILRYEGMKNCEIGKLLKFGTRTIDRYVHEMRERAVCLVKDISVDKVAGNLIRLADICIQIALRRGDVALAWQIECEKAEKLQSLGYVHKRPIEIKSESKIDVTVDDKQQQDECIRQYHALLGRTN